METLFGSPSMGELSATPSGRRNIARSDGGNLEMRFEIGVMNDLTTVSIRASQ